ncbi:MAG: type II toxin-antitoxin system HipA family toxin [Desulfomicrobium sp.]|nr:type II toxin-antitoxin system HipA family toxin [Pseudomonadota bacterium]MBV1712448.1 type II toxin-antitoxin system HipA family toxin [Desulfomicrobium sp.]MBU4571160.1 type II toxin-antitoxin system HipA family toxin [Pseudomonadota bacterium]MBU4592897.1 type II toxin-antitoxin system HipA family toxin [Pseudomonadota bacterium]MBV1720519.1 type II toxin-antitoxin system HipA family toxin [Desulfomicrobium sp.]
MMTSEQNKEAYVWIWLPGKTTPVVCGKLEADGEVVRFNYGRSYLERPDAIPVYDVELPLQHGVLPLLGGLDLPNCIRDASPDAWGRRVIINRQLGKRGRDTDTAELGELTYLLESGSDRIGALDFQQSPSEYVPRSANNARLEELLESADRVEKGVLLTPELDQALFHGSSIGGARPKALIEDRCTKYIAKFSSSSDTYSVVKAEYVAMRLAEKAGLNVAPVRLVKAIGKDVLLIERFDRMRIVSGWTRKSMVSALTLFGLSDMQARYASYEDFAQIIRARFANPKQTLHELYGRLVFNVLCGNTDDHARNHAAFWDGRELRLTPAYDICPQNRSGNEATQAMLIVGNNRYSQLKTCKEAANLFLLTNDDAAGIIDKVITAIRDNWDTICEEAQLTPVDKKLMWQRQFFNPFSTEL